MTNHLRRTRSIVYLVVCFSLLLSAVIISSTLTGRFRAEEETLTQDLHQLEMDIRQTLRASYNALLGISLTVSQEGDVLNFEKVSQKIIDVNPTIDALELLPNGVIEYVYPLKGNESVLGYDILQDSMRHLEAIKALEGQKVYFAGPFELKQGGLAIIGRLALFVEGKFWGFSAALIRMESFYDAIGLESLEKKGYKVLLNKQNSGTQQVEFFLGENHKTPPAFLADLFIPEGDWHFILSKELDQSHYSTLIFWIFLGLLFSAGNGYIVHSLMKLTHSEINQMHSELSMHLDNSPLGIVIYDTDLTITKWSPQCERILGWKASEILNNRISAFNLIYEEDLEKARKIGLELTSGAADGNVSYNRNYTKKGNIIHCIWYNSTIKDENGKVLKVMSLVQNITEEKQKEEIIRKRAQEWQTILNATKDLIFMLEPQLDGIPIIKSFNRAFVNISLKDPSELIGSPLFDVIKCTNCQSFNQKLQEVTNSGESLNFTTNLHKNENSIIVEIEVTPITSASNKNIQLLCVARDVTEKNAQETVLKKTLNLTKNQNDRLLNFAYIVSHNLRTHTSNIAGIIGLLKSTDNKDEEEKLINYLTLVSNTLDETMTHLNEVVNIQTQKELKIESLNLFKFAVKTKNLLREQIIESSAEIKIDIPEGINILFNKSYLESILINFLSNALKYSAEDRNPIIRLSCNYTEDNFVELSIQDNGIGINLDKHKDELFGLYKRFNLKKEGRGLGLFLAKNQIESLHGKVSVESTLGKGTTFFIHFPILKT